MDILLPVIVLTGLGLTFGLGLACALALFGVKVDPTVALIITKLPGSNCGACSQAGCAGFAEALKEGRANPSSCVLSSEETKRSIAELLGIEYEAKVKTIATILCNGGDKALDRFKYIGINSCSAASSVFGGQKACKWGCLGFGDCVRVCPFGAIKISSRRLPEVDPGKCTGCGKCVEACPRGIIILTPVDKNYHVRCNSPDPGGVLAKICKGGCIACGKCEKACPISAIRVEKNLAKIDYERCQNLGKCFEVCPTKVIVKR